MTFVEKVGSGANGQVWLAEYEGRIVAAKVANGSRGSSGRANTSRSAVLHEATMLQLAQCNAVVGMINIVDSNEGLAILMELADVSLDQLLRQRGTGLVTVEFPTHLERVCCALQQMHNQEMVSGDSNPGNILLTGGQAKLTDFGCARIEGLTPHPSRGARWGQGHPLYHCKPDISSQLTPASDVWMVAQTCYQMWTGLEPTANPAQLPEDMPLYQTLLECLGYDAASRPSIDQLLNQIQEAKRQLSGDQGQRQCDLATMAPKRARSQFYRRRGGNRRGRRGGGCMCAQCVGWSDSSTSWDWSREMSRAWTESY